MAVTFYPLTVKKVQPETADCVSIWLDVPEHLRETFVYKQGQYLTLRTHINGQEVRRTYSLCSSPLSGYWRVAVKQVPDGVFSNHVAKGLKAGDVLEALPPNGRFFTELDTSHAKQYMAFAAGSGITPILSIIETTLQTEPGSHFTLIYGNRNRNAIIFKEELEGLKNRFLSRFTLQYIFSGEHTDIPLQQGRIDTEKAELIFSRIVNPAMVDAFFLCGPQEMIFSVKDLLESKGIEPDKIHFELFNASKPANAITQQLETTGSDSQYSNVILKLDGISSVFPLATNGDSILDAALQQGANLPYACKGGVCCTCKARLVEGQVAMDVNYGLEPDEIAAGFILTCQAHPLTEKVVVDFDDV
jgi:ring-1,2-phenylacetyl-CoA epoxidase subunit PaaE